MCKAKAVLLALLLAAASHAAESIAGKWLMKSQQVSGQDTESRPLTLTIVQTGDTLAFEYSVTLNRTREVSLRFEGRIDGSALEVKDGAGRKIGTARILRKSANEYSMMLEGPNRPTALGKMTVSADQKTLTCESDAGLASGQKTHTIQVFTRQ